MRNWMVAVSALLLGASPLAAQHQGHGQGQQQGQGMMGMQGTMGPLSAQLGPFAPERVLEMQGVLVLTPDQVVRITAIRDSAKIAEEHAHAPARAAMQNLRAALQADAPAPEVLRREFLAHHAAMGNVQWVRVEAALAVRVLLTPAQRTHLEQIRQQ